MNLQRHPDSEYGLMNKNKNAIYSGTDDFYERNALDYITSTRGANLTAIYDRFLDKLDNQSFILDIGPGSGDSMKYFIKKGHTVKGIEKSKGITEYLCSENLEVICADAVYYRTEKQADAIWASAMIHHLEERDFAAFFNTASQNLKPGGILYVSAKSSDEDYFDAKRRLFVRINEDRIASALYDSGFSIFECWESDDKLGRDNTRWINTIAEKKR